MANSDSVGLLQNVNTEILHIRDIVFKLGVSIGVKAPASQVIPSDFTELLKEVQSIEDRLNEIYKILLATSQQKTLNPGSILQNTITFTDPKLAECLPPIDLSLSVSEELVILINEEVTKIQLEPIPDNAGNNNTNDKFIQKIQRIRRNLQKLGECLIPQEAEPQSFEYLYKAPAWSVPPVSQFYLEVREGTSLKHKVSISDNGHYLLGRLPFCDIVLNDDTCSRQHAVIQFRPADPDPANPNKLEDEVYIYDLQSTSGTYVNGVLLQPKAYYPLFPSDILQFGQFPFTFVLCCEPIFDISDISSDEEGQKKENPQPVAEKKSKDESKEESDSKPYVFEDKSTPRKLDDDKTSLDDGKDSSKDGLEPKKTMTPIIEILPPKPKPQLVPLDPRSKDFDREQYKKKMIEAYEKQRLENEEILRERKAREEKGLAPIIYLPFVPERPPKSQDNPSGTNKKKSRWWKK